MLVEVTHKGFRLQVDHIYIHVSEANIAISVLTYICAQFNTMFMKLKSSLLINNQNLRGGAGVHELWHHKCCSFLSDIHHTKTWDQNWSFEILGGLHWDDEWGDKCPNLNFDFHKTWNSWRKKDSTFRILLFHVNVSCVFCRAWDLWRDFGTMIVLEKCG